eukprot:2183105-Pyramimonas_sp.AAC.3
MGVVNVTCPQNKTYESDFPELGKPTEEKTSSIDDRSEHIPPTHEGAEQEPESLGTLAMYEEAENYAEGDDEGQEEEEDDYYDEEDELCEAMDWADIREGTCRIENRFDGARAG